MVISIKKRWKISSFFCCWYHIDPYRTRILVQLDPDPYLWLTDPDPASGPAPAPDPAIFASNPQYGKISFFVFYFLKLNYIIFQR